MNSDVKILVLDNYDSFTYNIVQYLMELGHRPLVIENDNKSIEEIKSIDFSHLIVSPGPGHPKDAGISIPLINQCVECQIPVLGICLGHQALAMVFKGSVTRAQEIHHGKVSLIYNNQKGIFKNLPTEFKVTRYHSLIVGEPLPLDLEITAWYELPSGGYEIMAIQHRSLPCYGLQFHPEAQLTEYGHELLSNFINSSPMVS